MHIKEIYVICIHLFDSGILLIIDLNKKNTILSYIKVITKLPNSEQSYKGKVQTHNYKYLRLKANLIINKHN
jgi:hypothetical protein